MHATSRLQSDREEDDARERRLAVDRAGMEARWATRESEKNRKSAINRQFFEDMERADESKERRYRPVREDVLLMILLRYRVEGLQLRTNNDPTYGDDPLYPFLNLNKRAKEIVREVVMEKKGDFGRQVVREVEDLEQELILREEERELSEGRQSM